MWPGAVGSTSMSGSLFGNGSSQSSFVFAPPLSAKHSNCENGPCCLANPETSGVAVRFPAMPKSGFGSSAPAPPLIARAAPNTNTITRNGAASRLVISPPLIPQSDAVLASHRGDNISLHAARVRILAPRISSRASSAAVSSKFAHWISLVIKARGR